MERHGYTLSREGLAKLSAYNWPGNLRELANVLERAMILAGERRLGPDVLDLPQCINATVSLVKRNTTATIAKSEATDRVPIRGEHATGVVPGCVCNVLNFCPSNEEEVAGLRELVAFIPGIIPPGCSRVKILPIREPSKPANQ